MVTDAAGNVMKRHDYFAFGEDTAAMTGDPRRFTGKELDPETALHYFGARYYRNLWGRFTSVDPVMVVALGLVSPQRWNRYSYALNNPLGVRPSNRRDGHSSSCCASRTAVAAVGDGRAGLWRVPERTTRGDRRLRRRADTA